MKIKVIQKKLNKNIEKISASVCFKLNQIQSSD